MIADTMQYPASSDYVYGGAPFVVLSPQHANLFHRAGWTKAEVKRRLWEAVEDARGTLARQRIRADGNGPPRGAGRDRPRHDGADREKAQDISIVVAGGPGSHSVFIPVSAHTRSVTREIVLSE